jgi:hypothetical protein
VGRRRSEPVTAEPSRAIPAVDGEGMTGVIRLITPIGISGL